MSARVDDAVLSAERIGYQYVSGNPVLNDWTASFRAGSMTALTGPSGRGKSTLLYLLGLMLRPTTGGVSFRGQKVSQLGDRARAQLRAESFGFVFQDAALDQTRTVMDNILETALYRSQPRSGARIAALGLLDRFQVDVPPDRRPGQVSGGQAQRIALCRALLNAPAVILADEPTGNLDAATSGLVVDALRERAEAGAAVIVVTHAADVAALCDVEIEL